MRISIHILSLLLMTAWIVSCVEPFDPPEIASPERIVVIEGTLDAPDGQARVILSEIRNIDSPISDSLSSRIRGAAVRVNIDGTEYALNEEAQGIYTAALPVSENSKARLTADIFGQVYESEEVTIKPVPEIDSITFSVDNRGITVEVTTHDPLDQNQYYQWNYLETAQYQSQFGSSYYYDGSTVIQRTDQVFYCWKDRKSTDILVATTDGLSKNVVYKFPLVFIPADSWKKDIKYSILVRQYSISEEAYVFLKELENNTENVGSLFDPQPGRIFGNITCVTDPNEYVIGQFSARSMKSRRFFFSRDELPVDYPGVGPTCNLLAVDSIYLESLYSRTDPFVLMGTIQNMFGGVIGYTYSAPHCMDCRLLRGGTNIEPDYWE